MTARRRVVGLLVVGGLMAACTSQAHPGSGALGSSASGSSSPHHATSPSAFAGTRVVDSAKEIAAAHSAGLATPSFAGASAASGSIAPKPPSDARPSKAPAQATASLRGHPLPTNQWWTSALIGPWTQPLVAGPLTVQVTASGSAVSYRPVTVQADHVIQPFVPAVTAGGALDGVKVSGYGPLHVDLVSKVKAGGTLRTTAVEGSPFVYWHFAGVQEPALQLAGAPTDMRLDGAHMSFSIDGQRWDVAASAGHWARNGARLTLSGSSDVDVVAGPAPSGAASGWAEQATRAARHPITGSRATLAFDRSSMTARQVLSVERAGGGPGAWALTPLQAANLAAPEHGSASGHGHYAGPLGTEPVVDASSVTVDIVLPGFLPSVPKVKLPSSERDSVRHALQSDLSAKPQQGGVYFSAKEMAREATIADVAAAVGDTAARKQALGMLRKNLVDWLTYTGPNDPHYFAYDATWGGLIGVPAEFGNQDYNDHHFQYGYLVRAAATMARADPTFAKKYGNVVDAIVRDYAGGGVGDVSGGFPSERVWDAGAGHSWASGYSLFADGNNQESSSEAVEAWAGVAEWGLATGRSKLADLGLARYAIEGAAARMYWLGDSPSLRPKGYAHRTVGIVWGDKIDFATWFSPKPEAVIGIQLLPVAFSGLYRDDAASAKTRESQLNAATHGSYAQWGNVFAADQALYDASAARHTLATQTKQPDAGTSRGLVEYLIDVLAKTGPPDASVVASGPGGLAMKKGSTLSYLTAPGSNGSHALAFSRDGKKLKTVQTAKTAKASS